MANPVLLFACGNPSRGDDALGLLLLESVAARIDSNRIDLLTDFQLQIEHALDLQDRELVLFADASVSARRAFDFIEVAPARDSSYTSHAMSSQAIMAVYRSIKNQPPPPCFLLSIQGLSFELGEGLSDKAAINLQQACRFAEQLLIHPDVSAWRKLASTADASSRESACQGSHA